MLAMMHLASAIKLPLKHGTRRFRAQLQTTPHSQTNTPEEGLALPFASRCCSHTACCFVEGLCWDELEVVGSQTLEVRHAKHLEEGGRSGVMCFL